MKYFSHLKIVQFVLVGNSWSKIQNNDIRKHLTSLPHALCCMLCFFSSCFTVQGLIFGDCPDPLSHPPPPCPALWKIIFIDFPLLSVTVNNQYVVIFFALQDAEGDEEEDDDPDYQPPPVSQKFSVNFTHYIQMDETWR